MAITKRGAVSPKANLTPMIDVIVQLLIFFLIICRIVTEEAIKLVVPTVEDSLVFKLPEENRVVVTLYHESFRTPQGEKDVNERLGLRREAIAKGESPIKAMIHHDGRINRAGLGVPGYGPAEYSGGGGGFKNAEGTTLISSLAAIRKARGEDAQVIIRADMSAIYRGVIPVIHGMVLADFKHVNLVAYMPEN